jgi:hypothetical protein
MPFRYRPPFEPAPFQSLKFLAVVRERRRLNPGKNPSFLLLVEVGLALVAYARLLLPRTRFTLRRASRLLIAGEAFVTTRQESFTQR